MKGLGFLEDKPGVTFELDFLSPESGKFESQDDLKRAKDRYKYIF